MSGNVLVGALLVVVGVTDVVAGLAIIGPRIADAARRRVVVGSLVVTGAAFVVLGGLWLGGVIGPP